MLWRDEVTRRWGRLPNQELQDLQSYSLHYHFLVYYLVNMSVAIRSVFFIKSFKSVSVSGKSRFKSPGPSVCAHITTRLGLSQACKTGGSRAMCGPLEFIRISAKLLRTNCKYGSKVKIYKQKRSTGEYCKIGCQKFRRNSPCM